jgi:hypothetical protein
MNPKTVMSIIIDGMDQGHCKVPYLGSADTFGEPLHQSIIGVKEHGQGFTIFRTVDTISKSADVTIYCVSKMLELWFRRNGYFPEVIYVQCDGGPENANKFFLSYLELLVTKRLAKHIYFTRLPTGHSHEDIDACFGVLSQQFRAVPALTLVDYKNRVVEALSTSKLAVNFYDIYVIPNYQLMLKDLIQPIKRLHKEGYTQHCWRFDAVPKSREFPFGAKAMYKSYSSDKVVELVIKPVDQCITPIGQWIGLEPITVYNRWYPIPTNTRLVDGMYWLKDLPDVLSATPCKLPPTAMADIAKCLECVRRTFSGHADRRCIEEWNNWFESYGPVSNSIDDYLIKLEASGEYFDVPLEKYILSRDAFNKRLPERSINEPSNSSFVYPELLAMSMPSVATQFNTHPPPPRVYSSNVATVTASQQYFERCSQIYYHNMTTWNNDTIKFLIRRKIKYDGTTMTTTGMKEELIVAIKNHDITVRSFLFIPIHSDDISNANKFLSEPITTDEMSIEVISSYNNIRVTRVLFRQAFTSSQNLTLDGMECLLELFRKRDKDYQDAYNSRNRERYRKSFFLNVDLSETILEYNAETFDNSIFENRNSLDDVNRIYLTVNRNEVWSLVVVDINDKSIYFVDGSIIYEMPEILEYMRILKHQLNIFLLKYYAQPRWNVKPYPFRFNVDGLSDKVESGIYLVASLYMIVSYCPIAFTYYDLFTFRRYFSVWVLKKKIPF